MNIANPPRKLLDLLQKANRVSRVSDKMNGAPLSGRPAVGGRNNYLTRIAGKLRRNGFDASDMSRKLLERNAELEQPLEQNEVERIAISVARYPAETRFTEQGLAELFADLAEGRCAYISGQGWRSYNGTFWERDSEGLRSQELVKCILHELRLEAEFRDDLPSDTREKLLKRLGSLERKTAITGIVKLASSDPKLLSQSNWEEPAKVVNFQNGTLWLPSLDLREHNAADNLSSALPYDYDPRAECPNFERVLAQSLGPDEATYYLGLMGYALTGLGDAQVMAWMVGRGRNGKSTLMEAVAGAMGSYAKTANPSTFMKSEYERSQSNDIARLQGARLVTIPEWPAGRVLDAATVKRMLGGEKQTARFLHKEFFEFVFSALPVLVTNYPPVFDGGDFGTARRIKVLEFGWTIPESQVDPQLPSKLKGEAPGIMNLLLRAAKDYLEKGLVEPASVKFATGRVVRDADQVRLFLDEKCDTDGEVTAFDLFMEYRAWTAHAGTRAMAQPSFKQAMERVVGVTRARASQGYIWRGLSLKK